MSRKYMSDILSGNPDDLIRRLLFRKIPRKFSGQHILQFIGQRRF